jgi:rRNA-processing protein FCF1
VKVILDTNTLLLLIVGTASISYIRDFKPTHAFSNNDFDLLVLLLNDVEEIVTIPQVIAETSNHLSKGFKSVQIRQHVWAEFQAFIQNTREVYRDSAEGSKDSAFTRLGITDAILAVLSKEAFVVVTCDAPLFHEIKGRDFPAINFYYEIGRQIQ